MMTDGLKILIVEDNQSDTDLLQRELKKNGWNFISEVVQTRESYENALESFSPDIILSDYSLPAFDGVTAFNIKQKKSPEIPFIIVSGTIGEEKSIELIKSGITDYALKEKIFSLPPKISRALKDAKEKREKKIIDEALRTQHEKLLKIAFLQSHQVRVPIANILGLFNLFEFDKPADPINAEVLFMLKLVADSLDKTIHEIVQNTGEIKNEIN
jgi:DNA-binding NtrC family response regulator